MRKRGKPAAGLEPSPRERARASGGARGRLLSNSGPALFPIGGRCPNVARRLRLRRKLRPAKAPEVPRRGGGRGS